MLSGFIYHLCIMKWFCSIQYTNEISPVEIINLFSTAIIAIWLGLSISKRLTEQRFIKEFLIYTK